MSISVSTQQLYKYIPIYTHGDLANQCPNKTNKTSKPSKASKASKARKANKAVRTVPTTTASLENPRFIEKVCLAMSVSSLMNKKYQKYFLFLYLEKDCRQSVVKNSSKNY